MKEISSYDELSLISGGKKGLSDDIMCGLLSAGLGMITFGVGALAAVACWVVASDIHI